MKESDLIELKINENYKRENKSPIRTLLKLTVNSKNKNNISKEKRNIINKNNNHNNHQNKLSKVSSASNVIYNYQNLNLLKNKKTIESYNNNENINFNTNNNKILLKKISLYNNLIKNNKNITVNCINNYNNYIKKKNEQNMKIKNIKNKKIKTDHNNNYNLDDYNSKNNKNISNYEYIKNYKIKNNYINKNKEIKQIKNNLNINVNTNLNTNENDNISFFNSRLEISNKKEDKKQDKFKNKIINKRINIKNKNVFEKPNSNRNSSCINFYNKYLKNNFTKKSDNRNNVSNINNNTNVITNRNTTKNNNSNNSKFIYSYKDIIKPYSTINNDELYLNRYSILNKKNKINVQKNQNNNNVIVNIKNENINTVNNILISSEKDLKSLVYSPKKGICRVHSQENVLSKGMDESYSTKENNIIYNTKSVKDLSNYTYSKKKYFQEQRNSDAYIKKKYGIIDISDSSTIKNDSKKENKNNIIKKIINTKTVINKVNFNTLNDKNYKMEPDLYPEIKINLKKKKYKKIKNNSVIIENHNNYNLNEIDNNNIINQDTEDYNFNKKINSIYNKYKQNNDKSNHKKENNYINTNNSNKNISYNSYISNINNKSNSNISFLTILDSNFNNFLNNADINNKNLKTNFTDKILSINDLYYILIYEEKIKDIFNLLLIDNINYISYYCFDLINFFCGHSMNKCIQNILNDKIDSKNLNINNNYTLFSIIIFYELSFYKINFKNVQILIKEILKLIYSNIILIIKQSHNILKNLETKEKNNISELYDIINNILNKYINNKELYIKDNEYIYLNQNNNKTYEEKIYSNLNFIIRNIHTIINNTKNIQNYEHFLNILNIINNISNEELNTFFITKILRINIFNSTLLSSIVLENDYPNQNRIQNKRKKLIFPYITNINKKKYTLILSLDDTIIHFKASTFINNKGIVQIRPGLPEFLGNVKNYYEIIVFSSGNQKYSDAIIDSIDEKYKYIDYRLYQEHCTIINDDFVKDLSKIGRPIDKMVIVDNMFQNYRLQKDNGINIKSFYGDNSGDRILLYLSKILIKMAQDGGDLRKGIKKYYNEIVFKISSNLFNNYCK